jgi:hypothetical protein
MMAMSMLRITKMASATYVTKKNGPMYLERAVGEPSESR